MAPKLTRSLLHLTECSLELPSTFVANRTPSMYWHPSCPLSNVTAVDGGARLKASERASLFIRAVMLFFNPSSFESLITRSVLPCLPLSLPCDFLRKLSLGFGQERHEIGWNKKLEAVQ